MTEHGFIRSIHSRLKNADPGVYIWKINDSYQGGVADAYYSGTSDFWVEYKFLKTLPKRPGTILTLGLSELQKSWLRARHAQGRRVCVIVGSPQGSVAFPGVSWDRDVSAAEFVSNAIDPDQVVTYILGQVATPASSIKSQEGDNDQSHHRAPRP